MPTIFAVRPNGLPAVTLTMVVELAGTSIWICAVAVP